MAEAHRHMAYLVSAYPATSHTFILREVLGLRALGWAIDCATINSDTRPLDRITAEERQERERVYGIKAHGLAGFAQAHVWGLLRHPGGYLRGLGVALRRASNGFRVLQAMAHFTEALMIGRWMQQRGHSHLHVHFGTAAASVASLVRRTFPITLSMTLHGPDEFAKVDTEHVADKVAAADLVVCISHFARSQAMNHSDPVHWHKMHVVRLGVFPPGPEQLQPPPKPGLRLVCVGRLAPAKAQHLLLDAMAELRRRGRDDVRLTLVGDGPDRQSLQAHSATLGLADAVRFTGALNQTEVQAEYSQSDALVLASFAEGIPVVLMEAMSRGMPCISTRIAGIPELIEHGVSGLLAAPSDVQGLVELMVQLADDLDLRQRLGQAGRSKVLADYNLERNVAALSAVFAQFLEESA